MVLASGLGTQAGSAGDCRCLRLCRCGCRGAWLERLQLGMDSAEFRILCGDFSTSICKLCLNSFSSRLLLFQGSLQGRDFGRGTLRNVLFAAGSRRSSGAVQAFPRGVAILSSSCDAIRFRSHTECLCLSNLSLQLSDLGLESAPLHLALSGAGVGVGPGSQDFVLRSESSCLSLHQLELRLCLVEFILRLLCLCERVIGCWVTLYEWLRWGGSVWGALGRKLWSHFWRKFANGILFAGSL